MRKNFGAKAILYPMPVLIIGTYDENGKPNAMNAAWGGISEETQISICVDDGHKTAKNVVKTGAFTVSVADAENVVACDYVGIVSGNKEPDKIEKAGWHATKSDFIDAPLFDELPMTMEDWADRLNRFLEFNEHEILTNSGRVTHEIAKAFAESEFEKYRVIQDRLYESDFDRFVLLEEKTKNEEK